MKSLNKLFVLLFLFAGVGLSVFAEPQAVLTSEKTAVVSSQIEVVKPSELVKMPDMYLDKTVKINARFDKFTTVGLDYPPALRKSDDYISFLVYRDDTTFDIPQSELKFFMKRDDAQKFVDLKSKDKVSVTCKVFSTALGDPWVDVLKLETIK